jgi:hypothetical protein
VASFLYNGEVITARLCIDHGIEARYPLGHDIPPPGAATPALVRIRSLEPQVRRAAAAAAELHELSLAP